jgi:succinoglycan biosynthesis protein ExoM
MITICLCTYRRPVLLRNCLESLVLQTCSRTVELVVVDNDGHQSARACVAEMADRFATRGIRLTYAVESVRNIALARNRAVALAQGEAVAFIDDDETAPSGWLTTLAQTLQKTGADAVFGPVVRVFPTTFPKWLMESPAFMNDIGATGTSVLGATSNCLVQTKALSLRPGPFRREFGLTGGEDAELFAWLRTQGCRLLACREALVREYVEEGRRRVVWHLARAYRSGWTFAKIKVDHRGLAVGAVLALRSVLLGSGKAIATTLVTAFEVRTSLVRLVVNLAAQAGKVGYFLGLRIEPYNWPSVRDASSGAVWRNRGDAL